MTGAAHTSWNESPATRAVADSATSQGDVIDGQVAGAYTGEVSAQMLARLGVAYVIAGHSERRAHCGETDEVVRSKVDAICRHGMRPILCVGETAGERRDGAAVAKVRWQVAAALADRAAGTVASAVIAYEPLWAIGAGQTATPGDAGEMCSAIRDEVGQLAGPDAAAAVRIQYGGPVTPQPRRRCSAPPAWTGSWSAARAWTPGSSPPSCAPGPDHRGARTRAQAKPKPFPARRASPKDQRAKSQAVQSRGAARTLSRSAGDPPRPRVHGPPPNFSAWRHSGPACHWTGSEPATWYNSNPGLAA
jgi:triosephosphate isomerase